MKNLKRKYVQRKLDFSASRFVVFLFGKILNYTIEEEPFKTRPIF